jgi:hypothetical protein
MLPAYLHLIGNEHLVSNIAKGSIMRFAIGLGVQFIV